MKKLLFTLICSLLAITQGWAVDYNSYVVLSDGDGSYVSAPTDGSSVSKTTTFSANSIWYFGTCKNNCTGRDGDNDTHLKHVASGKYLHITDKKQTSMDSNDNEKTNNKYSNKGFTWKLKTNNTLYFSNVGTYNKNNSNFRWLYFKNFPTDLSIGDGYTNEDNPASSYSTNVSVYQLTIGTPTVHIGANATNTATLSYGQSVALSLYRNYKNTTIGLNADLAESNVTWSSNSSNVSVSTTNGVATVTYNNFVTSQTNVTLTATFGGSTYTATITLQPVTVAFAQSSYDKYLDEENIIIAPTVTGTSNTMSFTYSSSNSNVAAVNSSTGELTLLDPGTVTITATSGSLSRSYTLNIIDRSNPIGTIDLSSYSESISGWTVINSSGQDASGWSKLKLKEDEGGVQTDGSNMHNKFLEIWDSNAIEAYSCSKTVTGLTSNATYILTGKVRAVKQNTNNVTPSGAFLFAGNEDNLSANISTGHVGRRSGESSRYATLAVAGTADASGNLVIGIRTKDISNMNWVNVKGLSLRPGPDFKFAQSSFEVSIDDGTFAAPTLTRGEGITAPTYTSSNTSIATVASDGTVTLKNKGTVTITASAVISAYNVNVSTSYTLRIGGPEYFTLGTYTSTSGTAKISIVQSKAFSNGVTIKYSTNGSAWTDYALNEVKEVPQGQNISFKVASSSGAFSVDAESYYKFQMTDGTVSASGTLGEGISELHNYSFYGLYENCTVLTSSPALSATSLSAHCYEALFKGCTALTSAPSLSATTLTTSCYAHMFEGCTALTAGPSLPNANLVESCYESMFEGCSGITAVPSGFPTNKNCVKACFKGMFKGTGISTLPTITDIAIAESCFESMFEDCKNITSLNDKFTPKQPTRACYKAMFKGCTGLTHATIYTALNTLKGQWIGSGAVSCYESMFEGCEQLRYIPDLNNGYEEACYKAMFKNCTGLVDLSGVNIGSNASAVSCYESMFEGCSNLEKAAEFASSLGIYNTMSMSNACFKNMYKNCTSLTQAPTIYVGALKTSSLEGMFAGCTSLEEAPALPQTNLSNGISCYKDMFRGCTSLKYAPALPADTLGNYCYAGMFAKCTALVAAPDLMARYLKSHCYKSMFEGDTNLKYIYVNFTDWSESIDATTDWVKGVGKTGNFIGPASGELTNYPIYNKSHIPEGWHAKEENFFCITCLSHSAYSTVYMEGPQQTTVILNYRRNNGPWLPSSINNSGGHLIPAWDNMEPGDKLYIKAVRPNGTMNTADMVYTSTGNEAELQNGSTQRFYFVFGMNLKTYAQNGDADAETPAATYKISGDITSLIDMSCTRTDVPDYAFAGLFNRSVGYQGENYYNRRDIQIVDASELILPATELGKGCYQEMFRNARNIKSAPLVLPATTVSERCYQGMFHQCHLLEVAPELHATKLAQHCYEKMFMSCVSLTVAPDLPAPADSLAYQCYKGMYRYCKSLRYISVAFDRFVDNTTTDWISDDIPNKGIFVCPDALRELTGNSYYYNYAKKPKDADHKWDEYSRETGNMMCFIATEDNTDIKLKRKGSQNYTVNVMTSKGSWNPVSFGSGTSDGEITVASLANKGDAAFVNVLSSQPLYRGESNYCSFSIDESKKVSMAGSVQSLRCSSSEVSGKTVYSIPVDGEAPTGFCWHLFEGCKGLRVAPKLPAVRLGENAYREMFKGCTNLLATPELPAVELGNNCYQSMFEGCTSLKSALNLTTASELKHSCYRAMFKGCTDLSIAPKMKDLALKPYCYANMFEGCISLPTTPSLPAKTMAEGSYMEMFKDCSRLTEAPILDATTLDVSCYQGMFSGCTNLNLVESLPAKHMFKDCYKEMFMNCDSLTKAPALNSTLLAEGCYQSMFQGCETLAQAPDLPALKLQNKCYANIFDGCLNLQYISASFKHWPDDDAVQSWVKDVANSGAFVCTGTLETDVEGLGSADKYNASKFPKDKDHPWNIIQEHLCFTAVQNGSKIALTVPDGMKILCYNGGWNEYTSNEEITFAHAGEKIFFKAASGEDYSKFKFSSADGGHLKFTITGHVKVNGYVTSLLKEDYESVTSVPNYAFYQLFKGCTGLYSDAHALSLPSTTLGEGCYQEMFSGCSNITSVPQLPAQIMKKNCYYAMFYGCSNIQEAPVLSAPTLAEACYYRMFYGCKELLSAPALPSLYVQKNCYGEMFMGCSSIESSPKLPAHTLAEGCYAGMFKNCTNLSRMEVEFKTWTLDDVTVQPTYQWVASWGATTSEGKFYCPNELEIAFEAELVNSSSVDYTSRVPKGWIQEQNVIATLPDEETHGIPDSWEFKPSNLGSQNLAECGTKLDNDKYSMKGEYVVSVANNNRITPSYVFKSPDFAKVTRIAVIGTSYGANNSTINITTADNIISLSGNTGAPGTNSLGKCSEEPYTLLFDVDPDSVSYGRKSFTITVGKNGFVGIVKVYGETMEHCSDPTLAFDYQYGDLSVTAPSDEIVLWYESDTPIADDALATLFDGGDLTTIGLDTYLANVKAKGVNQYAGEEINRKNWADMDGFNAKYFYARDICPGKMNSNIVKYPIYRYTPQESGYCLIVGDDQTERSQCLTNAILYASAASSINNPVKIFVPAGQYNIEPANIGEYVSLIGQYCDATSAGEPANEWNTIIQASDDEDATLSLVADKAYLQDLIVKNTTGRGLKIVGLNNTTNIKVSSAKSSSVSSDGSDFGEYIIKEDSKFNWTRSSDVDQENVTYATYNCGSVHIKSEDDNASAYLLEFSNTFDYILTDKADFYVKDTQYDNQVIKVRAANNRGGFGAPFTIDNRAGHSGTPVMTVQLNAWGYATFSYSDSRYTKLYADGAGVYVATFKDNKIRLDHCNQYDVIPNETGVILFGRPGTTVKLYSDDHVLTDEMLADINSRNELHGYWGTQTIKCSDNKWAMPAGTCTKSKLNGNAAVTYYYGDIFVLPGNTVKRLSQNGSFSPNKAFFDLGKVAAGLAAPEYRMIFGAWNDDIEPIVNETTVVENVNPEASESDHAVGVYNLSGLRTNSQSGLLIRDGKVEMIK